MSDDPWTCDSGHSMVPVDGGEDTDRACPKCDDLTEYQE